MNEHLTGRKAVLVSGFVFAAMLSGSVQAEKIDFTASTHVNHGTCSLSSVSLIYDYGNVTPVEAFAGTESIERLFTLKNCVAVNKMNVSLSAIDITEITSGTYKGKWVVPTTGSGSAKGVAFKTEIKNGATGAYRLFQADNKIIDSGGEDFLSQWSVYIKSTIIPTVAAYSEMGSGSLNSSAVINITYL
ncbi:hypothetical protein [Citrobacter braakii]|uniref:hypothetical protein n=1 Tax=Citrobacter braakii TaxID=57706 RepID=UPI00103D4994|nr:hypothetical protein [Citrobacter braakii]TCC81345.1 hypothetical protein EY916_25175 [Citrobacter braakii]HAT7506635.1 hypothetical protein [Citrobacter braakii]